MGALIREGKGIDRRVLACVLVLSLHSKDYLPYLFMLFFPTIFELKSFLLTYQEL